MSVFDRAAALSAFKNCQKNANHTPTESPTIVRTYVANPNYVQKSGRGTVTGRLAIKDSGDPNASAANTWVGLEQQPQSTSHATDFQLWCKAYQYWTKTDADGKFVIPNVIAGTNYTLWAFGGAPGTFLSQNQAGGNPTLVWTCRKSPSPSL